MANDGICIPCQQKADTAHAQKLAGLEALAKAAGKAAGVRLAYITRKRSMPERTGYSHSLEYPGDGYELIKAVYAG